VRRPTAVVTGASAGIGAAFARVLAARGHDLVVVARSKDRLEALADDLRREQSCDVEVLPADLEEDAGVARVEARLGDPDRPVELLVNNAGFGTSGRFHELPIEPEIAEIGLNVVALVRLSHAALRPMVERGHGGIINVSSVGAFQPTPRSATYAATKAFVSSFTQAVHEELRGTGVKAMVVAPGFTHTEFHLRAGVEHNDRIPEFLWQSPDEVAEIAMKAYERGRASCVTGVWNAVTAALSKAAPSYVSRRVAGMVTKRAY